MNSARHGDMLTKSRPAPHSNKTNAAPNIQERRLFYFHFSQTASRNTAMRQPNHLFQIDNPHIPAGFINLFTEALPAILAVYKPCQPFRHMQHRMLVMHVDEAAGNADLA